MTYNAFHVCIPLKLFNIHNTTTVCSVPIAVHIEREGASDLPC